MLNAYPEAHDGPHYLAKGGGLKSVQEMLGHESIETTQIDIGLAKRMQAKIVQD